MSLRNLMKAKASSSRLTHPLASYDRQGTLSCIACGLKVRGGDQLWGSHVQSKSHRVNVAKREEKEREGRKRKALEEPEEDLDEELQNGNGKRSRVETEEMEEDKIPQDFFTDPSARPQSQQPEPQQEQGEEEEEDPEWAAFQAHVSAPESSFPSTYSNTATISADPVMYDNAPIDMENLPDAAEVVEEVEMEDGDEEGNKETETERRYREDREEIMARMEEEEREQQEADARVETLKKRLEAKRAARLKRK